MFNVNFGCGDSIPSNMKYYDISNTVIIFTSDNVGYGCSQPSGRAYLNSTQDSIYIDYKYGIDTIKHTLFKGKRI
jgi:hypothetical protein